MSRISTTIACALSQFIYFVRNLLDILLLSLSVPFLHSCFVSRKFYALISCALFFSFHNHRGDGFFMFAIDIKFLGYLLFPVEYWLSSPFAKLAYYFIPNWRLIGTPSIY